MVPTLHDTENGTIREAASPLEKAEMLHKHLGV